VKRYLLWVLVVGLVVGALVFGKLFPDANSTPVDIDLLWIRVPNVEAWLLLVGSMLIGGVLATLVVGFAWLKARVLNRRYLKVIKRLEAELHQMRSLPLSTGEDALAGGPKAGKGKGFLARRASRQKPAKQGVATVAEGRG
jgi:uncharacterized membrane protein YciS (DUF1049 family)